MFFCAKTTMSEKRPSDDDRAAHRAYLAANSAVLLGAGPTFDRGADSPEGSILLFEAADWDAAEEFVKADPFYQLGFRASVAIFDWRPGGYARSFPIDPTKI